MSRLPNPGPLREGLAEFVRFRNEHLSGDEKGEAQVFLDRLFRAFGHGGVIEAGGKLEMRVAKRSHGGTAFADLVWRPRILLEMKRSGQNLAKHYPQAFEYWIDLVPARPQYVVLCNFDEFWIYDLNRQLDDPLDRIHLADLPRRWEVLGFLLPDPVEPVFQNDVVAVTRDAAATVVRVTNSLIDRGIERPTAQRFAMQILMAMFAEDVGLLPGHSYTRALEDSAERGTSAYDVLFGLFREMNTPGITPAGRYAGTPYFNGGLFREIAAFDLRADELLALRHAAGFDWTEVRPEIFGTLFEQSLGKDERHAFGAHFTSGADIQRVILPTIVRPWRERIDAASTLRELGAVETDLLSFRVLDPACGCGNFLYIAYRELRRLEKRLIEKRSSLSKRSRAGGSGVLAFVGANQFYGIDINPFAVEIAKVTLMLARHLAARELGDERQTLPLDDLDTNFVSDDALFTEWPSFDACIGNPPYLGRRRLIEERGASYASRLSERFPDVGGVSDYVVYWFRLAHDRLPPGGRAGLVGTNSIRETASRRASLDYIVDHEGTIVDAWSSLRWSGDANVHVSIVNWVKGDVGGERVLWLDEGDRRAVLPVIPGSLRESLDLRTAFDLRTNMVPKVCFQGQTPGHTKGFVLTSAEADTLRRRDPASAAVLYPYIAGEELLHAGRPSRWIIDFDVEDAMTAKSVAPGAYERLHKFVLPDRKARAEREAAGNDQALAHNPSARVNWHHRNFLHRWWQHSYRREDFLDALEPLDRYITVSRVASTLRLPVFVFVSRDIRPSDAIQAFALDDDYSFGILQSKAHELWFRGRCSHLKSDLRYTSNTVFNSFPWPQEPPRAAVAAVLEAVSALLLFRDDRAQKGISLADQYNSLRDPGLNRLRHLHERLDKAVARAYGFDPTEDFLTQLLELNHYLATREAERLPVRGPGGRGLGEVRATTSRVDP